MTVSDFPTQIVADYEAAVRAHYAAGRWERPVDARAQMVRALLDAPHFGLDWYRSCTPAIQDFWNRTEDRLASAVAA